MKSKKGHIALVSGMILIMSIAFFLFLYLSKPPDKPMPPPDFQPETLVTMQGTVERYGTDPEGNIDKILITDGRTEQWIHFPPHAAKKVLSVAGLKAKVSVTFGPKGKGPQGIMPAYEMRTISGSNEMIDVMDMPPPPPAIGTSIEVSGSKIEYQKDERGNVNAFILSGKLILLPPHTRESLLPLLESAKQVTVKGVQRDTNSGFVNENALDVVQPSVVVIDSVNYLIR